MKYVNEYRVIFMIKGCNRVKDDYKRIFFSNLSILLKRFQDFKISVYPENYKVFTEIPVEYVSKKNLKEYMYLFKGRVFKVSRNLPLKEGIFIIKSNIWDLTEENLYYTLIQLHRLSFYASVNFKFFSEIDKNLLKEKINLSPEIEERINKMIEYDNELLLFIKKTEKTRLEPFLWGKRTGTIRKEWKEKIERFLNFIKIFI
jgi:hypothetical protein